MKSFVYETLEETAEDLLARILAACGHVKTTPNSEVVRPDTTALHPTLPCLHHCWGTPL